MAYPFLNPTTCPAFSRVEWGAFHTMSLRINLILSSVSMFMLEV